MDEGSPWTGGYGPYPGYSEDTMQQQGWPIGLQQMHDQHGQRMQQVQQWHDHQQAQQQRQQSQQPQHQRMGRGHQQQRYQYASPLLSV